MTDRAELLADLIEQIAAVTPDEDMASAISELIGAAMAVLIRTIGKDDALSTMAHMLIAIDEGRMPEPPRRN
jgi:hypothetical protein